MQKLDITRGKFSISNFFSKRKKVRVIVYFQDDADTFEESKTIYINTPVSNSIVREKATELFSSNDEFGKTYFAKFMYLVTSRKFGESSKVLRYKKSINYYSKLEAYYKSIISGSVFAAISKERYIKYLNDRNIYIKSKGTVIESGKNYIAERTFRERYRLAKLYFENGGIENNDIEDKLAFVTSKLSKIDKQIMNLNKNNIQLQMNKNPLKRGENGYIEVYVVSAFESVTELSLSS